MMLRVQRERMSGGYFPTPREYTVGYGLTRDRLRLLQDHAVICHPGPMNRGLEIAADAADAARSLILDQVSAGVAVRMSVLYHLLAGDGSADPAARPGARAVPSRPCTKECHEHRDDPAGQGRRPRRSRAPRTCWCATASWSRWARCPRPATPRSSTPTAWWPCPAWSTCTPTCASRAARTPRPSRPARPRRPSAATPRCWPWPTPRRSPTPPRPPSGSPSSAPAPAWSTCSRSARSPRGSPARSSPSSG